MPRNVQKSIQTCFRVIFSKKNLCPVFHGGLSFRKFSKIFFFKIPKMHKIVPESIQACFERVLGQIFRKFFCPVFRGGSSFRKFSKKNIFKIPKLPKSVPKSIQTCFRVIFLKKFYAQCSMEGRVFDNFSNFFFFSKFQKWPKSFPKLSKRVLNKFWGKLFD